MKKIRALRADEIEVRVANINSNGCQLLLYKDARCDKRILDEVFGSMNWQDRYEEVKGNMYCSVGVYDDEKKEWIWKQDCGAESFAEKEKGEASDAFKRACFNWGIGRELYTKMFIWAKVPTVKDGNKYRLEDKFERFHVSKIEVDNEKEKIISIEIMNRNNQVVFTNRNNKKTDVSNENKESKQAISSNDDIQPVNIGKALWEVLGKRFNDKQEATKAMNVILAKRGYRTIQEIKREELSGIIAEIKLFKKE